MSAECGTASRALPPPCSLRGSAAQCPVHAALPQKRPVDGRAVEPGVTRQSHVTSTTTKSCSKRRKKAWITRLLIARRNGARSARQHQRRHQGVPGRHRGFDGRGIQKTALSTSQRILVMPLLKQYLRQNVALMGQLTSLETSVHTE